MPLISYIHPKNWFGGDLGIFDVISNISDFFEDLLTFVEVAFNWLVNLVHTVGTFFSVLLTSINIPVMLVGGLPWFLASACMLVFVIALFRLVVDIL